ncbi:hypothetical protein AB9K32_13980 [Allomuricauda sp. XS_ASV26]|uniref:Lipoprotein n=1 Tax=Flagellimonas marinaquae TaxID=254955 RepID=A0AA48HA84_9FLAO|nr:hypothetical protein [Allomuricauda ruestringensis]MCA0958691.1 hypothetical protein [Allomuricauda ruestringensis]BDW92362.1 hypothetical protein MACH07_11940 [Allomuricauda aquimarina]
MKKLVLAAMVAVFVISCSKDDENDCESCEKAKICDNGDGTYTFSYDGEEEIVKEEVLESLKLTPKEYVELVCIAGSSD